MSWLRNLIRQQPTGCRWNHDFEGINFVFSRDQFEKITANTADDFSLSQYIALRMLVEQGDAKELANGFMVPSEVAVQLDDDTRMLLELPDVWKGTIHADIKGKTGRSTFSVDLAAAETDGRVSHSFEVEGPIISFSQEKRFLLSPAQLLVFNAHEKHSASKRAEYDDLSLVLALQKAQEQQAKISLGHFEKLAVREPDAIAVEAELDEHGQLVLTPQMGQEATFEETQRVLGQLKSERARSLRLGKEIILFDDTKAAAVQEIVQNRIIPKEQVAAFLKNPTAFIDASLVDLDLGFSARVKGATRFRHAYFGDTDGSEIDWFGKRFGSQNVSPPTKLPDIVNSKEDLAALRAKVADARATGADEIEFQGRIIDVSDEELVERVISRIDKRIAEGAGPSDEDLPGETGPEQNEAEAGQAEASETTVVDVVLNDDVLESPSSALQRAIDDVLIPEEALDWTNYLRSPFPHQSLGTRWILGLLGGKDPSPGGLLADDMGLGKTFMALAAIDHYYKSCKSQKMTEKPVLVVAPLSLLENWKDEVSKTFDQSPFRDIVILQSQAQLPDYRVGGAEISNQECGEEGVAKIRFSLKVGSEYVNERLDMPRRLIITTYQTLRDYQFSLCAIDWGIVVFDEAQNIKNPNALQTRAAKGIKSDFTLLATGTPVENSLADFWCLFDTACPGFLESYQSFRQRYIQPILNAAADEVDQVRGTVGRKLREKVGAYMLRRVKEDNLDGLPEKEVYVGVDDGYGKYSEPLHSTLRDVQLDSYKRVLSEAAESSGDAAIAVLHKLRDVSLHPRLVFGGSLTSAIGSENLSDLMRESTKFGSLLDTLDEIERKQEKCIVFVINKKLQSFLSLALAKRYGLGPVSVINGDAKAVAKNAATPTRSSMIRDFETVDGFNIIIMSPIAAGVGLTVVGANHVIHMERHWNPAKEAQATDRVYRIGQTKDVKVYIPVIHHPNFQSFDVNLHQLLSKKSLLKDAVVTPEQLIPEPGGFGRDRWSPDQRILGPDLKSLEWQQFEALCAELLAKEHNAQQSWLTAHPNDYGADAVLATTDGAMLIQCKYVSRNSYQGYRAIKEVSGAKRQYAKALASEIKSLVFATNAPKVSKKTRDIAKTDDVEVLTGAILAKLLQKHSVSYADVVARLEQKRFRVMD